MSGRGRTPKQPGQTAGHSPRVRATTDDDDEDQAEPAELPARRASVVPTAPRELDGDSVVAWHTLWRSPVARSWDPEVEIPIVVRLLALRARYADLLDEATCTGWTSHGSQEQEVLNPRWRLVGVLGKQLHDLEDRLGLNPRARLGLGIQLGALQRPAGAPARPTTTPDQADDDDDDPTVIDA